LPYGKLLDLEIYNVHWIIGSERCLPLGKKDRLPCLALNYKLIGWNRRGVTKLFKPDVPPMAGDR